MAGHIFSSWRVDPDNYFVSSVIKTDNDTDKNW